MSMAACNKGDYYEKQFLDNPYQENPTTDGSVNGGGQAGDGSGEEGGTQGGVDSGVTGGGTTGSASTGSSSAGSTGGTDGSTSGGSVTGSTAGGATTGSTTSGTTAGSTSGGSTEGGTTSGSTTGGTTGGTTGTTTGPTTGGSSTGGTEGSVTGGSTPGGSTTGGVTYGDCNNGHGNDADGVDESNPTIGTEERCTEERFHQNQAQTKKLDVVWVIDNSGSMDDEQAALGENFNSFIRDFIAKDVDFKMGITTTDARSEYKGLMVSGSDTKLTSAKAKENADQFLADFRNMVKVGTRGSGNEKGLEGAQGFMQRYGTTFLRPDAYLAIVVLSDEQDQSAGTVASYVDELKQLKAEAGLVKMYSIVDVTRSNCCASGITTGYERYAEASNLTAGDVYDIRHDFGHSLSVMGDTIIGLLDSFALHGNPVPETLAVYVNDKQTFDYTYDEASRSIRFAAGHVPDVGAAIKVRYVKQ